MTQTPRSGEYRITIPIDIVVRVGEMATGGHGEAFVQGAAIPLEKRLRSGAEGLRLDTDYGSRRGYDKEFISGLSIPMPEPNGALANNVASLRSGEANAESGELKYEHFSIKMNKAKRVAIFTATNIDGNAYLRVDRRTGEVTDGGEGETWFKDPRISASFYLDQSFYSEWSTYFDRGHLTRRTDPTWGTTNEEAERANADTFHFTNCSPQHFRFNQSAKFWQGAERFVLENGALHEGSRNRITVFQGPIYSDQVDQFADDVQIPSSFFKVIFWRGRAGVRSVGLVVDQGALLSEKRRSLGPPRDVPNVDVTHWRAAIADIEGRTSLKFGETVRNADTMSDPRQPRVGEVARRMTALADLLA
jgi:endonuclease G